MRYNAHEVIVNIACAIIAAILSAFLWLNVINLLLWASTLKKQTTTIFLFKVPLFLVQITSAQRRYAKEKLSILV